MVLLTSSVHQQISKDFWNGSSSILVCSYKACHCGCRCWETCERRFKEVMRKSNVLFLFWSVFLNNESFRFVSKLNWDKFYHSFFVGTQDRKSRWKSMLITQVGARNPFHKLNALQDALFLPARWQLDLMLSRHGDHDNLMYVSQHITLHGLRRKIRIITIDEILKFVIKLFPYWSLVSPNSYLLYWVRFSKRKVDY